ncbi:MAG TPA: lysylphosphatidylglycerol synthase domain-containing protein, partial [Gemmatimonadales bacterium]|nr:lysylphosphatidylglycerol synthase domain-containing protein [Gemmatimonadales bacterium]
MKLGIRAGLITGLLLLALVIALATHFGKPEEFARLLEQARPLWLVLAVVLQVATYLCAGGVWQRALIRQGHSRSLLEMMRLGVVKLFMDQAVPSAGISGNVLVARSLRRRGLSHQSAVATVLAGLISFYIAYALATAAALVILWLTSHVSHFIMVLVTIFAAILALFLWALLWVTRGNRDKVPRWIRKIKPVEKFLA